jgi:hypothetical protein
MLQGDQKMTTRIYDYCGANRAETRSIRQIEKSKLMELLERERRLTNFLAEHHAELILQNPNKPTEAVETIIAAIRNHPQIKENAACIDNILDAYTDFNSFSNRIRTRTKTAAYDRLKAVSLAVSPF